MSRTREVGQTPLRGDLVGPGRPIDADDEIAYILGPYFSIVASSRVADIFLGRADRGDLLRAPYPTSNIAGAAHPAVVGVGCTGGDPVSVHGLL